MHDQNKKLITLGDIIQLKPSEYINFVNNPKTIYERAEIFSKKYQFLSHSKWYIVLLWLIPVILLIPKNNTMQYLFSVSVGFLLLWPVIEYIIHKYLFHMDIGDSKVGQIFHFMFHGIHHVAPKDFNHLVMPLTASIPLALILWLIIYLLNGYNYDITCSYMAGILLGYIKYDLVHYTLHKYTPKQFKENFSILPNFIIKYYDKIHKHHMNHHFSNPNKDFGVSFIE